MTNFNPMYDLDHVNILGPPLIHFFALLVSGLAVQEKGLSSSIGFLKVVLVIACNQDCYDSAANRADKSSFSSAMATPREQRGAGGVQTLVRGNHSLSS